MNRAFEKRQADLKKAEKEAARVAKQHAAAAAAAAASQNWEKTHKEAADVRHNRQRAVAQRKAARAQKAETLQATRATNKAVARRRAPVEAPVLEVSTLRDLHGLLYMSPGGQVVGIPSHTLGQLHIAALIRIKPGQKQPSALCIQRLAVHASAIIKWYIIHASCPNVPDPRYLYLIQCCDSC